MGEKAKITTLLLVLLMLVALALAGGIYYFYQKEHAKNLSLQIELEDLKTKNNIKEAELERLRVLKEEIEGKLKESLVRADTLTSDLEKEKSAKLEALSRLDQLKADLEKQKELRVDLEGKYNQAQNDFKKVQSQLNSLDTQKNELQAKVTDLQAQNKGVELGKIVVSPEAGSKAKSNKPANKKSEKKKPQQQKTEKQKQEVKVAKLEGKVLVVNKDYNFVVINLGIQSGINLGDIFALYHDDKYLGDVKVEKIHDVMAAAGFSSTNIKDKVKEGDRVVAKTK